MAEPFTGEDGKECELYGHTVQVVLGVHGCS